MNSRLHLVARRARRAGRAVWATALVGAGLLHGAPVPARVPIVAEPFPVSAVRLLPGPFRDAQERNARYLLSLDVDRLLHTFRLNVGRESKAAPLGGWERPDCELRGHSLGHFLSACALQYAATGDERFRLIVERLVRGLAEVQAAATARGFGEGYLSAFPESFLDRVDARQPVWAPWYTLHKIMAGLLDAHQWCGSDQALAVLERQADWVRARVDRLPPAQMQASLDMEFGGMNDVLANLYGVTGNPEHLRLARAFDHAKVFEPLARRQDRLDGLHANTQIPKFIGAAREFELTGEAPYGEIARFGWERVALHRSYVIGGHSDREHFFPVTDFHRHLSAETAETCNTYNVLKLTRHLWSWQPTVGLMDFYERALYNHILASQDPEEGMFVYLMSLKPGHFKTYSRPLDSFWCCVGTGMENHAKYGDTIYARGPESLFVNLFIPSELTWPEHGLTVRQETRFPEDPATQLRFRCDRPARFALHVRLPGWMASAATVRLNGRKLRNVPGPGQYLRLDRTWRDGDRVELTVPMGLHAETLPGHPEWVAFLHGPLVLAGELGREGLDRVPRGVVDQRAQLGIPTPEVPALMAAPKGLIAHLQPVPGRPGVFRTRGLGRPRDVTLAPFHTIHHQRYSVYWEVLQPADWERRQTEQLSAALREQALDRRTLDTVRIGNAGDERRHGLQGDKTGSGQAYGGQWRHATDGGWFSYDVTVSADQPVAIACRYFGGDAGGREFEILVEGTPVGVQRLENHQPGEFFEVTYPVPAELTRGKQRVTVRFQAMPGRLAGGLFGLRVLRAPAPAAP